MKVRNACALALLGLFGFASAALAEDAYIEATGTQFINTGYFVNQDTKLEVDYQVVTNRGQSRIFGANNNGIAAEFYVQGQAADSGTWAMIYGYNSWDTKSGIMTGDKNRHVAVLDFYNKKYGISGGGSGTLDAARIVGQPASAQPLTLFAKCNSARGTGVDANTFAKCKLYSFRISEKDVLIHDYVPAKKNGDVGLYDKVTGAFVADNRHQANAGLFTCGGDGVLEVEDDGHIENVGQLMVNSRHFKTPNTRFEIDFALTDFPPKPEAGASQQQWRIAGQDSADRPLSMYTNGGNNFSFGQGDSFVAMSTSVPIDYRRHQMIADLYHKTLYYTTGDSRNCTTNTVIGISNQTNTLTATRPLAIMGYIQNNNGLTGYSVAAAKAKYYRCRIFEADALVHDYVPCVKGGEPGFKDLVDGAFVTVEQKAEITGIVAGGKVLTIPDDGYIEATGVNQVIDTGYKCTSATRIEADFAFTTNVSNPTILQPWICGILDKVDFGVYNSGGAAYSWLHGTGGGTFKNSDIGATYRRRTMTVDQNEGRLSFLTAGFTNVFYDVTKPEAGLANTKTLPLFTRRGSSGGYETLYPYAKLYGFRIYEAGELVRDFRPFVQDGYVGLKDNLGTGGFVGPKSIALRCGGDIAGDTAAAYIESDGTQAIVVDYYPNPKTKIVMDYQMTEIIFQSRPFGVVDAISEELYIDGGGCFAFGLGDSWTKSDNKTADLQRHVATLDAPNRAYSITTGDSVFLSGTYASSLACTKTSKVKLAFFAKNQSDKLGGGNALAKMRLYSAQIFEDGKLLHSYLPYKDGETIGLKDVTTGEIVENAVAGANPFKIGGRGWNAEGDVFYTQPQGATLMAGDSTVLSAYAPGAVAYQWYCNGVAVEGATSMTCPVEWKRRGKTESYTVKATFDRYGVPVESESAVATVEHAPLGMTILVR